jgi:hypothetical protein
MLQLTVLVIVVAVGCVLMQQARRWLLDEPDPQLESIRSLGEIHDGGLLTDEEWKAVKRVLG